jgi:hypothetical protein
MIRLLITPAGAGKTHWLMSHNTAALADCTTLAHRAILLTIAEQLSITPSNRATIDDLVSIICAADTAAIALDNLDRTSPKLLYSLLSLSARHTIYATATDKRKCATLIDRAAAILIPIPPAPLADIIRAAYPDMPTSTVRRIVSTSSTPAQALHTAQSVLSGQPPPQMPATNIIPIVAIIMLAVITYIRRETDTPPVTVALVSGIAYYIRRIFWRST